MEGVSPGAPPPARQGWRELVVSPGVCVPERRLRKNVRFGFAVAIVVMVFTSGTAVWSEFNAGAALEDRTSLFRIRSSLHQLMSQLQDAETGQRGFLLTGDPSYLAQYDKEIRAVVRDRAELAASVADMPAARQAVDGLDTLINGKVAELGATIALRRDSGLAAALRVVQTGRGEVLMDSLRRRVERLEADQASSMEASYVQARAARRVALATSTVAGAFAVFSLFIGAHFVVRNLARRAGDETALRESEDRLFRILDLMPVGVYVVDASGRPYHANREAQRILGAGIKPHAEVERLPEVYRVYRAGTDELYPAAEQPIVKALAGQVSRADDFEILRPDGRIPIEVQAAPVFDASGRIAYAVAAFSNIAARRLAEEALRSSQRFLDSIVESIPNMVFVKDADTLRFVRFNKAGERLVGYAREELIGRSDADFFPPHEAAAFSAKDREVLAGGDVVEIAEERIHTRTNGVRILHTRKVPIVDAAGRPIYLLGVSEDITEAKQAAEQLQLAREEAEAANRAKSDFLAKMSHELRTPLNSIIGFSEVLEDQTFGPLTERQRRYVRNVQVSGRQLLELVNDVLDLAKVEAGRMDLDQCPLVVAAALEEARALVAPLAERKRLVLEVDVSPELPPLTADLVRVRQILNNLLGNAIKYTPDGGRVRVGARLVAPPSGETGDWLEVSVADTGIGIAPADHERIFEEFEQVDADYVRGQQGTGLGLALTRRLVALHGGLLTMDSELGKGTTFRVLLPLGGAAVQASMKPTAVAPGGPRVGPLVLVVDDHAESADLLTNYLQEAGYRVALAPSGASAVALARTLRPAAITLDILLPDRDGHAVLTDLKSDPGTRDIPVIVVSVTEDRSRGDSLGVVEWFVKPVARNDLIAAMQRVVTASAGRRSA